MNIYFRTIAALAICAAGSFAPLGSAAQSAGSATASSSEQSADHLSSVIARYDKDAYAKAKGGDAEAQYKLGIYLMWRCEWDAAAEWLLKAAKQKHEMAVEDLEGLAERGHAFAQYSYGTYLGTVLGNREEAFKWYVKAAEQDNLDGLLAVAISFQLGLGVEQNYEKARLAYEFAEKKKSPLAALALGDMYRTGEGVKENLSMAFLYYQISVEYDKKEFSLFGCGREALSYLSSYSEAGYAEASYHYGLALDALYEHESAIRAFVLAVQQDPLPSSISLFKACRFVLGFYVMEEELAGDAYWALAELNAARGNIDVACNQYENAYIHDVNPLRTNSKLARKRLQELARQGSEKAKRVCEKRWGTWR